MTLYAAVLTSHSPTAAVSLPHRSHSHAAAVWDGLHHHCHAATVGKMMHVKKQCFENGSNYYTDVPEIPDAF
ncbi:hypothetical protein L1987_83653 [Smallanthus sonchifolius]|uniref:Uncharacterized protein n=1 Tax=Smallanthus sonchifolius TaxID=185202 RepID=A0ACB8YCR3_9ASTR|nr:hypothetical protein L1987_83653 [Smallanthus sonchifolius]